MEDFRKWKKLAESYNLDNAYNHISDEGEHDHEASMARGQLYHIAKDAIKLIDMIKKGDNLEGWVASKITKAKENISVVADYMESEATVNREAEMPAEQPVEPVEPVEAEEQSQEQESEAQ
tara:strand:+ start:81 stop:443 length:363 start_codon:yes stop_codon:yes gene_type:complete